MERSQHLSALQVKQEIPDEKYKRIAAVHNSNLGHWGHALTKKRLNDPTVTDRMISEFIRQCPHQDSCASYNPFEVLHLDHIGPLRPDV